MKQFSSALAQITNFTEVSPTALFTPWELPPLQPDTSSNMPSMAIFFILFLLRFYVDLLVMLRTAISNGMAIAHIVQSSLGNYLQLHMVGAVKMKNPAAAG
jgi:hypothetical protein